MSQQGRQVISYAWSVGTEGNRYLFNRDVSGQIPVPEPHPSLNANSSSPQHVGLFAFGHVYEYSAMGVTASRMGSNSGVLSQCNVAMEATKTTPLGAPKITQKEFHDWLDASSEVFSSSKFDIVTNNSVTWAEEATRVLGVPPDGDWSMIKQYYLNNPESCKRLEYASPTGASRHKWVGNTNKNCSFL